MLSTPHLLVGAALGSVTNNVPGAFVLGIISHLILDAVPHTDQVLLEVPGQKQIMPPDYFNVTFDLVVGTMFVVLISTRSHYNPWALYTGALGAVTPDLISNVPFWSPYLRSLPGIAQFHRFHHLTHHHPFSQQSKLFGVITQFCTIVFALLVLLRK